MKIQTGDMYSFGRYGGEAIEWRVLEMRDGAALLISEKVLECKQYHSRHTDVTWSECSLRAWLNGEFLQEAFDDSERAQIRETELQNDDHPRRGTPGGPDTCDLVFCLSVTEAERFFADEGACLCCPTPHAESSGVHVYDNGACDWWLRSPGFTARNAACARSYGYIQANGLSVDDKIDGVRPAMWVEL